MTQTVEPIVLVAIIGGVVAVLSALVTFFATKGKTKTDAKTALDARIDARVEKQLEAAWTQIDDQAKHIEEITALARTQAEEIKVLQAHAASSARRERVMYRYTKDLRTHVIKQLPPPPPTMPVELVEWFEEFEKTDPGLG